MGNFCDLKFELLSAGTLCDPVSLPLPPHLGHKASSARPIVTAIPWRAMDVNKLQRFFHILPDLHGPHTILLAMIPYTSTYTEEDFITIYLFIIFAACNERIL